MVSKKKYVSFLHLRTGIVINPCILLQNLNTTYCYNNCIQIPIPITRKRRKNIDLFFLQKRQKSLIFLLLNIYVKESWLYFASKPTYFFCEFLWYKIWRPFTFLVQLQQNIENLSPIFLAPPFYFHVKNNRRLRSCSISFSLHFCSNGSFKSNALIDLNLIQSILVTQD